MVLVKGVSCNRGVQSTGFSRVFLFSRQRLIPQNTNESILCPKKSIVALARTKTRLRPVLCTPEPFTARRAELLKAACSTVLRRLYRKLLGTRR
jgi:hypothetical protein